MGGSGARKLLATVARAARQDEEIPAAVGAGDYLEVALPGAALELTADAHHLVKHNPASNNREKRQKICHHGAHGIHGKKAEE
jgi:hypothetical protein